MKSRAFDNAYRNAYYQCVRFTFNVSYEYPRGEVLSQQSVFG
jgi:hypothetical protein